MRMRRLKRRKGNRLESSLKEFIGGAKGCEEDVMESRTMGRKVFL